MFSIIKKSQLEGANRLDAEYYQPEYLESADRLDKFPRKTLSEIAQITDGNHLTIAEQFVNSGTRYLRGKDLQDFFISDSDPMYIPDKLFPKLKRSHILKKDVLISIVGTVGLISIVADDFERLTGSCKVAILHVKGINPWFLAGFLLSRYGQDQLQRKVAGAVQTGIILKDLSDLVVPIFSDEQQEKVRGLLEQSYAQKSDSESLYLESEKLLLQELGLTDFQNAEDLAFEVNFSDAKNAGRMDADYFQPKYARLQEKFFQHNGRKLGDMMIIKKGFEPGSEKYEEEGKLFIRVSSLSIQGLEDKDQKYLNSDLYEKLKNEFEPKVGEILLTKDATPGIAYVLKESVEGIISGGILRLKPREDMEAEYIALCINSIVGHSQVERDAGGSIIAHWRPEQVKELLLPILPKPTQQKIADLVRKSHEARKKSKELLEQAKRKVEEMIEKGGD
ncbi:MAG: restriction endonuclease subunit S [Candidatus Gottesmanbacteria bacterium]|nr:restriction endonuclease subunit S [Candidatus Gottesmanbacteria bacterium]